MYPQTASRKIESRHCGRSTYIVIQKENNYDEHHHHSRHKNNNSSSSNTNNNNNKNSSHLWSVNKQMQLASTVSFFGPSYLPQAVSWSSRAVTVSSWTGMGRSAAQKSPQISMSMSFQRHFICCFFEFVTVGFVVSDWHLHVSRNPQLPKEDPDEKAPKLLRTWKMFSTIRPKLKTAEEWRNDGGKHQVSSVWCLKLLWFFSSMCISCSTPFLSLLTLLVLDHHRGILRSWNNAKNMPCTTKNDNSLPTSGMFLVL